MGCCYSKEAEELKRPLLSVNGPGARYVNPQEAGNISVAGKATENQDGTESASTTLDDEPSTGVPVTQDAAGSASTEKEAAAKGAPAATTDDHQAGDECAENRPVAQDQQPVNKKPADKKMVLDNGLMLCTLCFDLVPCG